MTAPLWAAYERWRTYAGPLADFVLPTPFLAPWQAHPVRPEHPQARAVAAGLVGRAHPAATAVFLEASPRLGLAVAASLTRTGWAPVPLYGRWPERNAVLPVLPLTCWLSAPVQPASTETSRGYCLLLDAERRRRVTPRTLVTRFDNRYEYGPQQLPPHALWAALGVRRLVWVAPAAGIPPELDEYAASMGRAGLTVETTSLAHVSATGAGL